MSTRERICSSMKKRPTWSTLIAVTCLVSFAILANAAAAASAPPEEQRLLQALRQGGVVILIRHAVTDPGVGDPPGFSLADCSTQRNLSEDGREQARRLGRWFAGNGIRPTSVRVSPWCRARDTATLAFGSFEDWAALSNLLRDRSRQDEHAGQVRAAIRNVGHGAVDVLVSHGVSINAFVGVYLQQGEMVVVRPAGTTGLATDEPALEVVGRLLVPAAAPAR